LQALIENHSENDVDAEDQIVLVSLKEDVQNLNLQLGKLRAKHSKALREMQALKDISAFNEMEG